MIARPVLCRPFIGRREELAFLRRLRLDAASSHGGLVLIEGDAGVGKSRLVSEFCASLAYSRYRIAQGACGEFARRPYAPVLDALAHLDGGRPLEPVASKREQIDALAGRFAAIAARTALIVVIEDVHWADVATFDLLTQLGPRLSTMRALFLVTLRSDHPRDGAARAGVAAVQRAARAGHIVLGPLEGIELRTFVDAALSGIALPDTTRRAIARAGEGNPFFTEELLKSAVEQIAVPGRRDARALPRTLAGALLARLEPFGPEERRVIEQAAVIGRTFGLGLLAATLGTEPEPLLPALRRARDVQLIEELEPQVFRFRHGLTREAIYGDFLAAELVSLHRTVALALEAAPERERAPEALAYHWAAAGDGARAARFNELAGDAAGSVHAHEDAVAYYERALASERLDPTVRGGILEKIAERRIALGGSDEAHATYSAAADLFHAAGSYEREAACRVHAAILAYTTGKPDPTGPLEAMLERLAPDEYLARSRVHLGLAWLAATFWFPSRASYHLEHVDPRALSEAPDIGLRFHNVAAWVAMTFGDPEAFRREHAAWTAAARESGSVRTHVAAHLNGAMCHSFFGHHAEALEHVDHAFRIAREARNGYAEENCHAFAALCYLTCGELERARAAVAAVPATTENHVNFTFATAWGTIVAAHLDDAAMIATWFDGYEAGAPRTLEIECGAGLAEIMSRRGRHDDAAALLHAILPECELIRGNVPTLLAVGRYGTSADRARAREHLARAAEGPVEMPERPALALFDAREHERAGRTDEAVRLAGEAASGFRRLGLPLLEAAALELAGATGEALALYRRCGARHDVARLGGALPPARSPARRRTGGSALSSREREIARSAARGDSNLEIARALAISHKTVEKHLASAFRKLGVSSRRQLRTTPLEPGAGSS